MSDLTQRIAKTLDEHGWIKSNGLCCCGYQLRSYTPDAIHEHQAEQVRAVLGETTVEYGLRYGDGDIVDGYDDVADVEREITENRSWIVMNEASASDYEPMTIVQRTVNSFYEATPWTEVRP